MKQSIEIEVPEGYELTGEYRAPKVGDVYLNWSGHAQRHTGDASMQRSRCHLILRKIEPDAPTGFKLTGEYRVIREGDWYVSEFGGGAFRQVFPPESRRERWILHQIDRLPQRGLSTLRSLETLHLVSIS